MNKRSLFLLLPLSILCFALPAAAAEAQEPAMAEPAVFSQDFEKSTEGAPGNDLTVTDGEAVFEIVREKDNKVLRMQPAPLVEGGVLLGPTIKGPGSVKARVLATSKRRSHPRFGVGMHGMSGYRVWIVPAVKELHLIRDDAVVARVPYTWASGSWVWLKLEVKAGEGDGSTISASAWQEGQPEPDSPLLTHKADSPPGTGKASLWASPFSSTPVSFDDASVTGRP